MILGLVLAFAKPSSNVMPCPSQDKYRDWLQGKGFEVICKDPPQNSPLAKIDLTSYALQQGWDPATTLLIYLHNQNVTVVYEQPGYFWWTYTTNIFYFRQQ